MTHRAPPESANATPLAREGGAARKNLGSKNERPKDSPIFGRIQCWDDVDRCTDQLNIIANWKSDLLIRIERARLRFELLDVDLDFADLHDEVCDFRRACSAIMWRPE
jgi:hypothetical protein